MNAGYIVLGQRAAVVETGPASTWEHLRRGLEEVGVGEGELAWILVTHIHLDHAGGAAHMASVYPKATVAVHPRAARHLVEPARLVESAAQVYGGPENLRALFGSPLNLPAERAKGLEEGEVIDLGGKRLRAIYSPGHTRNHIAYLEEETGTLFVGDAAGVRLPGGGHTRPTSVPTDFDLETYLATLDSFRALRPSRICFSHYGPVEDVEGVLEAAKEAARRWAERARLALERGSDVSGLERELRTLAEEEEESLPQEVRERYELGASVSLLAYGLAAYFARAHGLGPGWP